ncbi:MAG: PqqD family protein [Acidimicrobiia bacterium]
MATSPSPLRASSTASFRPLETGGVVLNIENGDYYELNPAGRFLWEQMEAGADREALVAALAHQYGIEEATCGADVDAFLADLRSRQLLES